MVGEEGRPGGKVEGRPEGEPVGRPGGEVERRAGGGAEGRVGDKGEKSAVEEEKKREKQLEQAWLEHAKLSFTACYRDDCMTHCSAKEGARYFPKEPCNARNPRGQERQCIPQGIEEVYW